MVNIKINKTGQVIQVTKNVAHDLIERGEATLYKGRTPKATLDMVDSMTTSEDAIAGTPKNESAQGAYNTRQMRSTENK